jgi:hypothetical protein
LKATPKGEQVVAEAFGPVFAILTTIIEATAPADRGAVSQFLTEIETALDELLETPAGARRVGP